MARKPRPAFVVSPPSEYNGMKWYATSKRLGMRYGPYDTKAEAQKSADHLNELVTL